MSLVPKIKRNDWRSIQLAIEKLASIRLGPDSTPIFAGLALSSLTASRLLSSDGDKQLVSSDLASWVAETANQVLVADNGDGTITLSAPQDIDTAADVQFASLTVNNTGLHLLDTNASHDLIIAPGSDLTADRALTITTGDFDRIITLSGNPTLADWFDQSVKQVASPTFAGLNITAVAALPDPVIDGKIVRLVINGRLYLGVT